MLGFAVTKKDTTRVAIIGGAALIAWYLLRNIGLGKGSGGSIPDSPLINKPYSPVQVCAGTIRVISVGDRVDHIYFDGTFLLQVGPEGGYYNSWLPAVENSLRFLSTSGCEVVNLYWDSGVSSGTMSAVFEALDKFGIVPLEIDSTGNRR